MRFSTRSLAPVLAIVASVQALPAVPSKVSTAASEFVSAVCTAPTKNFNSIELGVASLFCSGFLHVKTLTVSVTSTHVLAAVTPPAVHKTVTLTTTAHSSLTTILSTTTSTTLPAVTSYATQDVTPPAVTDIISTTLTLPESIILDTLAPASVTITNTDVEVITSVVTTFQTVSTTTVETFVTAETLVKRQAAPSAFASYAASVVSQACSCLVHTPTITVSLKATSTPATLVASTVTISKFASTNIVVKDSTTKVITKTLPASTIPVTITTTLAAPSISVTQTITADALTSTQTITPSPVTITSQTTTYTTAIETTTTAVVASREFVFQLAQGPADGCYYDAALTTFIVEAVDGNCANNCAQTPGCMAYSTQYYVPGGGTGCALLNQPYQADLLNCEDYSYYTDEVVYNLVGVGGTR